MKLPHLTRRVPLERGEAGALSSALQELVATAMYCPPMGTTAALRLTPLWSLRCRLLNRHVAEQQRPLRPGRRPKAWPLRVRYDELAAVLVARDELEGLRKPLEDMLLLRHIVGKFQRVSLNLTKYITFD